MSLFDRVTGIFLSPLKTTQEIARKPALIGVVILIILSTGLTVYFSAPFQNADTLEMTRNNIKLQERLGQERFDKYIERLENPSQVEVAVRSFFISPIFLLIGFLIQSGILLGMGKISSGGEGKYLTVFSLFLHSRLIDVLLGGGLRLFLVLTKKSFMDITLSPVLFFPNMEYTSVSFMVLSQFDFFQIWAFGVIGIGLSQIFKIDLKKGLVLSYSLWLIKILIYIGMGLITRQFV